MLNFSGLRFPQNEARKLLKLNSREIRSKIRGKVRDEDSKNSGNFRSATFSDLTKSKRGQGDGDRRENPRIPMNLLSGVRKRSFRKGVSGGTCLAFPGTFLLASETEKGYP